MSDDRKRRIVLRSQERASDAGGPPEAPSTEAPSTEAERRAAAATRERIERGTEPLVAALVAAWRPAALSETDHEALLRRALDGDDLAPPTAAELAEAERLRHALEAFEARDARDARDETGADAAEDPGAVARVLRAAYRPGSIDPRTNDELVERALAARAPRRRRRRVLPVTMAALATAVAMAASAVLVLRVARERLEDPSIRGMAAASLVRTRSTAPLFDESAPFPRTGGETARVDRIVSARAADLRANRFAAWGVP